MTKLYGIEFFRGIAAIMVVVYHISRHFYKNYGEYPFSDVTKFGHSGVDFFFTLSGFIILYVHNADIGKSENYYSYLVKRLVRVYPIFWVVTLAHLALIPFISSAVFPDYIGLLTNFVLWPQGHLGLINGVSWTLQHEVLFYILFSILVINSRFGYLLFASWFCAIFYLNYSIQKPIETPVIFSAFNIQFFLGMVAAKMLLNLNIPYQKFVFCIGVIGFSITAIFEVKGIINGYDEYARLYYGFSSMLIILGAVSYEKEYGLKIPSLFKNLGSSSYSIYLTHLFLNGIFFKILLIFGVVNSIPFWASAMIIIFLILSTAYLISAYIEIPMTKYTRSLLLRK